MTDKSTHKKRKKRPPISAEKKYQIFLEAQRKDGTVAELLRREGLYATDLTRIRLAVQEGAIERLKAKPGRKKKAVDADAYEDLKKELEDKERALADLSVELSVLRKKVNGGSWDR
jgi:transposase-like protein